MRTTIEFETGEPQEFGIYLTVRKSRITGVCRLDVNQYARDDLMKNGPLPKNRPQGWQIQCPDACDIVAWKKIDQIDIIQGDENV
jgi:hypothetical protein